MSGSVVSSFKTQGTAECVRTCYNTDYEFCELLKNFTAYLFILTLIFSLQVILAKKIGRKI